MTLSNTDPGLIARIEDTLQQLRPYLEADSGNVSLIGVTEDMVVSSACLVPAVHVL